MENDLKLYTVNTQYINYLKKYQKNIWNNEEYKRLRPYVGIIIIINDYKYYAPLSSPKEKHEKWKDRIDFIRIDYKNELKGVINSYNIIPVDDNDITLIDIDKEEKQYADLLKIEMIIIRKKKDLIINNARKLYEKITKYKNENMKLADFCYDFLKLEEKMREYQIIKRDNGTMLHKD